MRWAACLSAAVALAGCNAVSGVGDLRFADEDAGVAEGGGGGAPTASSSGGAAGAGGSAHGGSAGAPAGTGGSGGSGGAPAPPIFASTQQALWRLDVVAESVEKVVDFAGCMIDDIALREDGALFGVKPPSELVSIDPITGQCGAQSVLGTLPSALHFDPGQSTVVKGYENDDHLLIQIATGAIGEDNDVLAPYVVGGDSVAVGSKAYVSVKDAARADCLVEVDPIDGSMLEQPWPVGAENVWGLAASGPFVYGFTGAGGVLRIDPATKTAREIAATGLSFAGAASLPSAP